MMPTLLKIDKWCEDKIGLDIIKQNRGGFFEKYPLLKKELRLWNLKLKNLSLKNKENLCLKQN